MERLGRVTTSLPDLPIDRRMTYGAMRRAIIGLPVTVSSALLPDGLWGCYDASNSVILNLAPETQPRRGKICGIIVSVEFFTPVF